MKLCKIILSAFLLLLVNLSFAEGVSVDAPYVREVPPGQMISASFMTLKNDSDKEIALIKASSDVAKTVELHEHVHEDGMMKMRQVPKIIIPAKGTTELKPGGYHIMLIGLQRKIKSGDKVELNLEFDNGDKETITATVKKVMMGMMKSGMKGMKHMGGGMPKMGKMDTKAQMKHLNPMPNLMQVLVKMPEKLNLSKKQTKIIQEHVKTRKAQVKELFAKVTQLENELQTAALNDEPLSKIDQLADTMLRERQGIIHTKASCATDLKGILDKKQFQSMLDIYKSKIASKLEYSDNMQGKMKMIKHVNPMPNLMLVIKKMGDKLNLTEKQAADLKQWRDERGPVMKKQYATIVKLENEIQEAALNNAPAEKIAELSDSIAQERMKVIRGKAFCRDNMKRILDNEQYKKVVEAYKSMAMN